MLLINNMPLPSNIYNRVAFVGKMGAGKSHTAKWLRDTYDFKIFSFADGLKQAAQEYYDMDPSKKDRCLLQTLGDAMRSVDRDVFAKRCVREITQCEAENGRIGIIIDDLRFENELRALREMPGQRWLIIKIKAHPVVHFVDSPPKETSVTDHASEHQWTHFKFDYEIESGDTSNLAEILREAAHPCSIA
tara:strand:- start:936 stop:1505 length:570 start_codon:yes stop_codon:yes gene_type:complete